MYSGNNRQNKNHAAIELYIYNFPIYVQLLV